MAIRDYHFVPTIIWATFILALSFVETPLRFLPEQVSRIQALSIGHLVFHALNYIELALATLLIATEFGIAGSGRTAIRRMLLLVVALLLIQTLLLFTVLDQRTLALIDGQAVEEAHYHLVYIVMELVKLSLLVTLAFRQIRLFNERCLESNANRSCNER